MDELFVRALGGHADALEGIAALVAIVAIIPSAALFIVNQIHQNSLLREDRHRYVTDQYHAFLDKCLTFPRLRLGAYEPMPSESLSDEEIFQRDTLFDLMTSMFESAYLAYANRISSYRKRQWDGWDAYINIFVARADYREWWLRIVFGGDPTFLSRGDEALYALNISQYDRRFEKYLITKLRGYEWSAPERPRPKRLRGEPPTSKQL